jgi:hypothetical protein
MAGLDKPKTGGRSNGVPNVATRELRRAIQEAGALRPAIAALVQLATTAKSEGLRFKAAGLLVQAAAPYGKATTALLAELARLAREKPLALLGGSGGLSPR